MHVKWGGALFELLQKKFMCFVPISQTQHIPLRLSSMDSDCYLHRKSPTCTLQSNLFTQFLQMGLDIICVFDD